MKKIIWIPLLVFLISCQPSKITQSWTAKNVTPKKYQKILVLGVLTETDNDLQIKMEDHLSGDLKELGYKAVAANKIFPAGTFVKGDTARAVAALNDKGFDAIMTIALLDKKKEQKYIPGHITYHTNQEQFNRFDRYYNNMSDRIFTPGYYTEETKYFWENNFYDLKDKKLIYSTRTRSFDFTSKNILAHTYGLLMVNSLVGKNILIKPETADEE
jgi:hypothetical protein